MRTPHVHAAHEIVRWPFGTLARRYHRLGIAPSHTPHESSQIRTQTQAPAHGTPAVSCVSAGADATPPPPPPAAAAAAAGGMTDAGKTATPTVGRESGASVEGLLGGCSAGTAGRGGGRAPGIIAGKKKSWGQLALCPVPWRCLISRRPSMLVSRHNNNNNKKREKERRALTLPYLSSPLS